MSVSKRRNVGDLTPAQQAVHKAKISNALNCFTDCTIAVMQYAKRFNATRIDGDLCSNAYAIVMTYHKAKCQELNSLGNIRNQINDTKQATLWEEVILDWAVLKTIFSKIFTVYGMEYKREEESWVSIANPTLYSFLAFRHRMSEVHMGTTSWRKKGDLASNAPAETIMQYGMTPQHAPLCEGITFPPFMKGPLMSSLGPGALMIYCLENSTRSGAGSSTYSNSK